MAILKLTAFAGESPKLIPRLLPDNAAQLAINTRLDDGGLTPVRKPHVVHEFLESNLQTLVRHAGQWLGWATPVHAVPGPVASDRLYITGDGAPKMRVGSTVYPLAVPIPTAALTATLSGTATSELGSTRLYVYTWVTEFGEESEPCPVSAEIYWKPGQTVTLSGFEAVPTGRAIVKQRIYRSQSAFTGTQLYLIAERDAVTTSFVDNVASKAIQEPLPSLYYNPPIDTLRGLTSMPGGMMAAFSGKDLYFCEPYQPHAWPVDYVLTTDYDIVGLGAFGNSLAVMTTGNLYLASGTSPESMQMQKLELNLPCIAARGIVDLGYAIAYPSHDGLVLVSDGGARVISEGLFSRDDWLRMNPDTFFASQYDGRYFVPYRYLDENNAAQAGTMILDLTGEQQFVIRSNLTPQAMYYEPQTGNLYMLVGQLLYQWDDVSRPFYQQTWKSKLFALPRPTNFGAILIEGDTSLTAADMAAIEQEIADILASNATLYAQASIGGELGGWALNTAPVNGDLMQQIPGADRTVTVNIYADRRLVATANRINRMCRLPSGYLASLLEVEVVSDLPISQITLATTGAELMQG